MLFREIVIVESGVFCPYCLNPNQLDPARVCCGEVHAQRLFIDENDNAYTEEELWEMQKNPVEYEIIREDLGVSRDRSSDNQELLRLLGKGEL